MKSAVLILIILLLFSCKAKTVQDIPVTEPNVATGIEASIVELDNDIDRLNYNIARLLKTSTPDNPIVKLAYRARNSLIKERNRLLEVKNE